MEIKILRMKDQYKWKRGFKMKKLLAILLLGMLMFAGCGKDTRQIIEQEDGSTIIVYESSKDLEKAWKKAVRKLTFMLAPKKMSEKKSDELWEKFDVYVDSDYSIQLFPTTLSLGDGYNIVIFNSDEESGGSEYTANSLIREYLNLPARDTDFHADGSTSFFEDMVDIGEQMDAAGKALDDL
jgi:hypothetical protein